MKKSQCEFCLYLNYDELYDEYFCSLNLDQDDIERLKYTKHANCHYFKMGDDYTIVKKQI